MSVLFRRAEPEDQENSATILEGVGLGDLAELPRWCAWRGEERTDKDGKITKVPYSDGQRARSNDPRTWLTIDRASAIAGKIINGHGCNASGEASQMLGSGGVGFFLGLNDIRPGLRVGGVDLDTCMTGEVVAGWALDVVRRLDSYTEVSPSRTGLKVFFLYRTADLVEAVRLINKDGQTGIKWALDTGSNHPPAIELYLSHRYFAVTAATRDDLPGELIRVVSIDDLQWLIEVAGPEFAAPKSPSRSPVSGAISARETASPAPRSSGGVDSSRSAKALGAITRLLRSGKGGYENTKLRMLNHDDPAVRDWMAEKGLATVAGEPEREFRRAYDKAKLNVYGDYKPTRDDTPEESPPPVDNAALADKLMDEATATPTKKLRGSYKKLAAPVVFEKDDSQRGHYFNSSYQVATCEKLSIKARGLYWWLESQMSNINVALETWEITASLKTVAKGCAMSINTAISARDELRDARVLYYEGDRHSHIPCKWILPLRRERLRLLHEQLKIEEYEAQQ